MRNLGLFFPTAVTVEELAAFGLVIGGISISESTLRMGEDPDEAYLDLHTELSNGCFDEEEFGMLFKLLGFAPVAYVSIHMNRSEAAFEMAESIARSLRERWGGSIDYSGAGGSLGQPFQPPDEANAGEG